MEKSIGERTLAEEGAGEDGESTAATPRAPWRKRVRIASEFDLRAELAGLGISVFHAAAFLGLNRATIHRYLKGETPLSLAARLQIEAIKMLPAQSRLRLARIGWTLQKRRERES